MYLDKQTFEDLSIFNKEDEFSIFNKINFTKTVGGREFLKTVLSNPHDDIKAITEIQNVIKCIINKLDKFPKEISNGTIIMIERFFETNLSEIPSGNNFLQNSFYKTFLGTDYGIIKFSVSHFIDFFKGIKNLIELFDETQSPFFISQYIERAKDILQRKQLSDISLHSSNYSQKEIFRFARSFKLNRHAIEELVEIYFRFDAWYSMAKAVMEYNLYFPEFVESKTPVFSAKKLYHLLLRQPVSYDVALDEKHNFMFLTGANMAGKSTLIKSVGAAVFLAQIGMGVPAASLKLSLFDGILTNIQIEDNIARGESYFYNEVQRIKNTIQKISDGKKWMVLIDELFKGTNIQDAMNCSLTVIKGLIKINHSLFILSTHLYEIGEELKLNSNIIFRYFEIKTINSEISFSYQLKEGISEDRIGYLILEKESVIRLLDSL